MGKLTREDGSNYPDRLKLINKYINVILHIIQKAYDDNDTNVGDIMTILQRSINNFMKAINGICEIHKIPKNSIQEMYKILQDQLIKRENEILSK